MLISAVAMLDTRKGALPDLTGASPGGLASGFYPFWSAALVFISAAFIATRALTTHPPGAAAFKDRQAATSVLMLVVPMVVAVISLAHLGLYLMTALYMGFFGRVIGHYGWRWVGLIAASVPLAVYLAFELGFRVGLPKSFLYDYVRF